MLYITLIFFVLFVLAAVRIASAGRQGLRLHAFGLKETLPLRGILAVCVFLTHLCPHLDEASPWLSDPGLWGPPSVACFFMLAGYGLAYSVKTKGKDYLDGFFRKRLSKLVWPFAIMVVIYQTYKLAGGTFSFQSLLAEPSPLSWFIYALLIWYVAFYFCFKGIDNPQRGIMRIWLFTAVYMAVTVYLNMGYYWISILPLPMAVTYVFYEHQARAWVAEHPFLAFTLVFSSFVAVMGYTLFAIYQHHLPGWGPIVYTVLPVWVVFLTYVLGGAESAITNFLGSISYEIYIVHGFVLQLLADTVLVGNGDLNSILVITLLLLLTCGSAWLLAPHHMSVRQC
jgi:peptidoglycan/LPS O-acetylase OafA/YrhL